MILVFGGEGVSRHVAGAGASLKARDFGASLSRIQRRTNDESG